MEDKTTTPRLIPYWEHLHGNHHANVFISYDIGYRACMELLIDNHIAGDPVSGAVLHRWEGKNELFVPIPDLPAGMRPVWYSRAIGPSKRLSEQEAVTVANRRLPNAIKAARKASREYQKKGAV